MDEKNLEVRMREIEQSLGRMEEKLDNALEVLKDHEERLRTLEGKPAKRWEGLVGQLITLASAGFIGWVLGQLK